MSAALIVGTRFVIVVDDPPVRRCGIHGDDTTSGRCPSCDADRAASPKDVPR